MGSDTRIEAWVRGRFVAVPGATARHIRANAWMVRIPRTPEVAKALRLKRVSLDTMDDLVLALDEVEAELVVGSAEHDDAVEVSVLL